MPGTGGCPTGEAKLTRGYHLPAKYVIHTVGPVWAGGDKGEDAQLASCYLNCFAIAEEYAIRSIAFPAVSTGAYGFPLERATAIALAETNEFLRTNNSLEQVTFVCFSDRTYRCYLNNVHGTADDSPKA